MQCPSQTPHPRVAQSSKHVAGRRHHTPVALVHLPITVVVSKPLHPGMHRMRGRPLNPGLHCPWQYVDQRVASVQFAGHVPSFSMAGSGPPEQTAVGAAMMTSGSSSGSDGSSCRVDTLEGCSSAQVHKSHPHKAVCQTLLSLYCPNLLLIKHCSRLRSVA